jgi:hypothetical protein
MMQLMRIKSELNKLKAERFYNKALLGEADVVGLAKLREALALIDEAGFAFAKADYNKPNGEAYDSVLERLRVV